MSAIDSATLLRRAAVLLTVGFASITLVGCGAVSQFLPGGESADIPEGEEDVFSVAVGDCLNDSGETEVMSVEVIECTEPHDYEAYLAVDMPDGEYPGEEAVAAFGDEQCAAAFVGFVGAEEDQTSLGWTYYSPLAESWATGDREILCLVGDTNGQVSVPLEGAGPDFPFS